MRLEDWSLVKHACKEMRFAEVLWLLELGERPSTIFEAPEMDSDPNHSLWSAVHCCFSWISNKEHLYSDVKVALRGKRQKHLRDEAVKALISIQKHHARNQLHSWASGLGAVFTMLRTASDHCPGAIACMIEAGMSTKFLHYTDKLLSPLSVALDSATRSGRGVML